MLANTFWTDQVNIKFKFWLSRITGYGLSGLSKRLVIKLIILMLSIILFPVSILLFLFGFRRLLIFTERIGHLAIEPDTLLKAERLGIIKSRRWFILAPHHRVANQHLLQYWKCYFPIFTKKLPCFFLHCLSNWPFIKYNVSHFINNDHDSQLSYTINKLWGKTPPILTLNQADNDWGNIQLNKLGIPADTWFVCVHVREGGFSPVDEVLHSHRNGKIENLIPAILEITKQGGWVIRLGDSTMAPLKEMAQVIDYAHHPLRNARLDIILCARAKFILGNTSGMFLVGTIFGIPSALANMIPMPTLGFLNTDISIPKLYQRKYNDQYCSFNEIMSSSISVFRYASLYEKENIMVIENNAEDILWLAIEMLEKLAGNLIETEADKDRHNSYMNLFQRRHYGYGANSSISLYFLRKYQHLL